jgi:hypothetical protein
MRVTALRLVPTLSTHLHEESFTLQMIQPAILKGKLFGYGRKAIPLRFTFKRVLENGIRFDFLFGVIVFYSTNKMLSYSLSLLWEF